LFCPCRCFVDFRFLRKRDHMTKGSVMSVAGHARLMRPNGSLHEAFKQLRRRQISLTGHVLDVFIRREFASARGQGGQAI